MQDSYAISYVFLYALFSVAWTEINGIRYKPGPFLVVQSDLMPQFGKIKDIVVVDTEECFFVISVYETEFFNSHYHAYEVSSYDQTSYLLIRPNNLIDHHVLHLYNVLSHQHVSFIPLKYHIIENI